MNPAQIQQVGVSGLTRRAELGGKGWRLMTATLEDVAKKKQAELSAEARAAVELVRAAKEQGLSLTGPDGLLKQLTKTVLETALDEEMTEHLGYEKHDWPVPGAATSATAPDQRRC
jgi:putative transposase